MDDTRFVVVQTFNSQPAADLARSALEAAGIESMSRADSVGHMRDHLAWSTGGFQVYVREEDAEAAREVLSPGDQGTDG